MNRDFEDERHDRKMTVLIMVSMITALLFIGNIDRIATDKNVLKASRFVKVSVERLINHISKLEK